MDVPASTSLASNTAVEDAVRREKAASTEFRRLLAANVRWATAVAGYRPTVKGACAAVRAKVAYHNEALLLR